MRRGCVVEEIAKEEQRPCYTTNLTALAVEEMDPLDLELLEEFVGEAAQNLEIALERLENGAPLFVWPGDLRFESDVSSEELLARCPGLRTPTR